MENVVVSLIVRSYNQEKIIREAVKSALSQTYSPLEIVFSDNCSNDRTFEIIKEETSKYQGPANIILNRNEHNLGLVGNLNKAIELSSGGYIVMNDGDDISYPERVERLVKCWQSADPPVDLVCSYFDEIDVKGDKTGYIAKDADIYTPLDISKNVSKWECVAFGATSSYSRNLFEKYGPVNNKVILEDWVWAFRATLESGIAMVKEPLIKYRVHGANNGVLLRCLDLNLEPDIERRKDRRFQAAMNRLGIAEEWFHAWKISGRTKLIENKEYSRVYFQLQRLVKLRKMWVDMFTSSRIKALIIIIKYFLNGGGFVQSTKHFARFVLYWQ